MRNAIEQGLAQPLGIFRELDLSREMFARFQSRGEAADRDRDDEVGRESQRVFEFRDVQGEERRDEEEIPRQRAKRGDEQDRAAIQDHPGKQHAEQVDERNGCVTSKRCQEPASDGESGHTCDRGNVFLQRRERTRSRDIICGR